MDLSETTVAVQASWWCHATVMFALACVFLFIAWLNHKPNEDLSENDK